MCFVVLDVVEPCIVTFNIIEMCSFPRINHSLVTGLDPSAQLLTLAENLPKSFASFQPNQPTLFPFYVCMYVRMYVCMHAFILCGFFFSVGLFYY